jgi:hypothetical protein
LFSKCLRTFGTPCRSDPIRDSTSEPLNGSPNSYLLGHSDKDKLTKNPQPPHTQLMRVSIRRPQKVTSEEKKESQCRIGEDKKDTTLVASYAIDSR